SPPSSKRGGEFKQVVVADHAVFVIHVGLSAERAAAAGAPEHVVKTLRKNQQEYGPAFAFEIDANGGGIIQGPPIMSIQRFAGNAAGRSRAVGFENLVFTVATAPGSASVQEQTHHVLARIEQNLADAGSDKTRLLSTTVYLADIASKA